MPTLRRAAGKGGGGNGRRGVSGPREEARKGSGFWSETLRETAGLLPRPRQGQPRPAPGGGPGPPAPGPVLVPNVQARHERAGGDAAGQPPSLPASAAPRDLRAFARRSRRERPGAPQPPWVLRFNQPCNRRRGSLCGVRPSSEQKTFPFSNHLNGYTDAAESSLRNESKIKLLQVLIIYWRIFN